MTEEYEFLKGEVGPFNITAKVNAACLIVFVIIINITIISRNKTAKNRGVFSLRKVMKSSQMPSGFICIYSYVSNIFTFSYSFLTRIYKGASALRILQVSLPLFSYLDKINSRPTNVLCSFLKNQVIKISFNFPSTWSEIERCQHGLLKQRIYALLASESRQGQVQTLTLCVTTALLLNGFEF